MEWGRRRAWGLERVLLEGVVGQEGSVEHRTGVVSEADDSKDARLAGS